MIALKAINVPSLSLSCGQKKIITLKAINASFLPPKQALFLTGRSTNLKDSTFCLCKSDDPDSKASPSEGDTHKQELLARIAMLEAQKICLSNSFAEEANAEFDRIGEDALKGLDEAGARVSMQAFEESAELNRIEIEENENKLADIEGQMVKDWNEGMFFKNLGQKAPIDKAKATVETERIKDLTKAKTGSNAKKNIYLALMAVPVMAIADSFIYSSPDWWKVAVLGAILVG
ncbi:hypothetical protein P3X46_008825 [Hevea brasiliensis]|uniref:Uncharacterized protein n=1 Tax=Hevea brasiliensis TaxID=3981 RepID=A0ABQ9MNF4_HEVBR|nr:hypothetical protein P3X46_008825 [Hevea brasiliensis]